MSDQGFVRQRPRQAGRRSPCGDAEIQAQPTFGSLAGRHRAKRRERAFELVEVKRRQLALRLPQDSIAIFSQLLKVVEQIDKQKLRRELFGETWFHPEIELPIAQLEHTMPLVVVDQCAVV